jgi:beta-galactosidase GanA
MNLNHLLTKKLITILLMLLTSQYAISQSTPHLQKTGNATQLIVNNKPFIVLGGELYNSSSSKLDYLNPLWAPLKKMNLNTVLAAVSWELIEPVEGKFDFKLVDGILKGAREHNLHVALLWFGTWKNGLSHYTPAWVKKDTQRFPRVVLENGQSTETISALSQEGSKADAKAFAALMKHVKMIDGSKGTVIMVQVENEVGVIGGTRDHSAMANTEFAKPVPEQLMSSLVKNKDELQPSFKNQWNIGGSKEAGTWSDVFRSTTFADEAFMAWHYGNYINAVAKAGKAEYNIPMFINTWVVQPEDKRPGDYPAGGPQAHVHDIYRAAAPYIDIKAPDIYLPDFKGITALYHHPWNPLFIPESFSGEDGAANAFFIIGQRDGIGYSPFGIDKKETEPTQTPIAKAYDVLNQLTPEILKAQANGTIRAFILNKLDSVQHVELGGYHVTVTLKTNWKGVTLASKGYGLLINTGKEEFTVAGSNVNVSFVPATGGLAKAGLESVREGKYQNGLWIPGRQLNGDEIMISYDLSNEAAKNKTGTGIKFDDAPDIQKIKLYRF